MFDTVIRFIQEGGAFMMPIAVVLVLGLAIALERSIYLSKIARKNSNSLKKIQPLLQQNDFDGIININDDSPIYNVLSAGIHRAKEVLRRDEIESAMEESIMETVPRLEKRTSYLATLANIATLMGLLGTIIGLIAAFTAVASADPSEKASLLSQSISVAMNTTAFGLISAIPLLLCHAVLQTKTAEVVDKLDVVGIKFLNMISRNKDISARSRNQD